jgi:4'-phosphopantetheinyl transferase EntD
MMADLVPGTVVTYETREELVEIELPRQELEQVSRAVEKRKHDFMTGRVCAHRALGQLGELATVPIASGDRGEPLWPSGVVGSITHCRGFRACAVAWKRDIHSLGIDAEVAKRLPAGVLEIIASQRERRHILCEDPALVLDTVLFSAKEAVFKAWYPLTKERLKGHDIDIDISVDARHGGFRAQLLVAGPQLAGRELGELRGRWRIEDGIVATAMAISADGRDRPKAMGSGWSC